MFVNSDFTDLLKIFNTNNVSYLTIGMEPLFYPANN